MRVFNIVVIALAVFLAVAVPLCVDRVEGTIQFTKANFAFSTLANALTGVGNIVYLTDGASFPYSGNFRAVIWGAGYGDPTFDSTREIVTATFSVANTFVITRAQESTLAKAWAAGSYIAAVPTVGVFTDIEDNITAIVNQPTAPLANNNNGSLKVNGLSGYGSANQIPGSNSAATAMEYKTVAGVNGVSVIHSAGLVNVIGDNDRLVSTTLPLTGGGDLTADRTLALSGLSGYGGANEVIGMGAVPNTLEYKEVTGIGNIIVTHSAGGISIADNGTIVPAERLVNTTAPLTGGGDLTADRMFAINGLSTYGDANQLIGVNSTGGSWEYKTLTVIGNIVAAHSAGGLELSTPGVVNSTAPAVVDNQLTRFDGISGTSIQNSPVVIEDDGDVVIPTNQSLQFGTSATRIAQSGGDTVEIYSNDIRIAAGINDGSGIIAGADSTSGPLLRNVTPSRTTPTVAINYASSNTGLGGLSTDNTLSLIANGTEVARFTNSPAGEPLFALYNATGALEASVYKGGIFNATTVNATNLVTNSTASEDTGLCIFDGTSGRVLKGETLGPRYSAGKFDFSTGSAARSYYFMTDQGSERFDMNSNSIFRFLVATHHSTSSTPAADFLGAMYRVNPDGRQCTGSSATQSIWHVAGNNNQSGTARYALYSGYMTNTAGGSGGSYFLLLNTPTTSAGINDAGDFVSNGNTGITNTVTISGCALTYKGGILASTSGCTVGP